MTSYLIASYPLDSIRRPHWSDVSGGVYARAPQPLLHAYVMCDEMLEGEIDHSGEHGPCPHEIKVCIVKKDNDPEIYDEVKSAAEPRPERRLSCREDALRIVGERQPILGPVLRWELELRGHGQRNMSQVLPRMVRKHELSTTRSGHSLQYSLPSEKANNTKSDE